MTCVDANKQTGLCCLDVHSLRTVHFAFEYCNVCFLSASHTWIWPNKGTRALQIIESQCQTPFDSSLTSDNVQCFASMFTYCSVRNVLILSRELWPFMLFRALFGHFNLHAMAMLVGGLNGSNNLIECLCSQFRFGLFNFDQTICAQTHTVFPRWMVNWWWFGSYRTGAVWSHQMDAPFCTISKLYLTVQVWTVSSMSVEFCCECCGQHGSHTVQKSSGCLQSFGWISTGFGWLSLQVNQV